jgi:periplasmic divalent cation tolerance protein
MDEPITIYVTAPTLTEAESVSKALLEDRLIACANLVEKIHSHYRWKGKLYSEREVLIIMKSQKKHLQSIINRVKELHSYEVPEIIALPIIGGSPEYLKWLSEAT